MKIAITGGGTLGHVVPGLAVASRLCAMGHEVIWIGRRNQAECRFVEKRGIRFLPISSGKLRRYASIRNLAMPFQVAAGYFQARRLLIREKPAVLFSKGGFVSVPVAKAARSLGIPVVTHESDASSGLATRLIAGDCQAVCLGDERNQIKTKARVVFTGNPVRDDILHGDGRRFARDNKIPEDKAAVLVLGGSQGALKLSEAVAAGMDRLAGKCYVLLQTGSGKRLSTVPDGLWQFESFDDDLGDALDFADIVVSRAGAGAIAELVTLCKPMILVPLGLDASRGDQIDNAREQEEAGRAIVADYGQVIEKIEELIDNESLRDALKKACLNVPRRDSAFDIAKIILEVAEGA